MLIAENQTQAQNEILVTVVLPVLNGMPYFPRTLDGVCMQTLRDIEILVVDADSDDGTREFIEQRAAEDSRVRLIESDMRSSGRQCNIGVEQAKGQYVAFVESDDYIDLDMMERLYSAAEEHGFPDAVKSDFERFVDGPRGEMSARYGLMPPGKRNLYNKVITLNDFPGMLHRDFNIWNAIYRTDFLREEGIRQHETKGAAFQDNGLNIPVQLLAQSQVYIQQGGYHCRRDNDGSSMYKKETGLFSLHEMEYLMDFLDAHPLLKHARTELVFRRTFGSFALFYGQNRYWSKPSPEYEAEVEAFPEKIRAFMAGMDAAWQERLLRYELLAAFLRSIDEFRAMVDEHEWDKNDKQRRFAEFIMAQPQVVVFGSGEVGTCVAMLLENNRYTGNIVFCDNNKNNIGHNHKGWMVYSPHDAVRRFPEATFLIPITNFSAEMRKQLKNDERVPEYQIVDAPDVSVGSVFGVDWERLERR